MLYVPHMLPCFTWLCALRTHVPYVPACLRAFAFYLHCIFVHDLRAFVFLRFLLGFNFLRALLVFFFTCLAYLPFFTCFTCLLFLRAFAFTFLHWLRSFIFLHALRALICLRALRTLNLLSNVALFFYSASSVFIFLRCFQFVCLYVHPYPTAASKNEVE